MQYYIDPENGRDQNTGCNPGQARRYLAACQPQPGDQVLFKRGTTIRETLFLTPGTRTAPIHYGAYGSGPKPVLNPSLEASQTADWEQVEKLDETNYIWRYTGTLPTEVCNLVFNDRSEGAIPRTGNLRWTYQDLRQADEWFYDKMGGSMHSQAQSWPDFGGDQLYLVARDNPGRENQRLEIVVWGQRNAIYAQSNCYISDLCVEKSGVHGLSATQAENITLQNCDFRFIGGAVFDRAARIRLGNAVEFWDGAQDCLVEHCTFVDIYDSGVTHQGGLQTSLMAERLYFRHNLFIRCGLAAYEWRGPTSREVYFEDNVCLEPGGAFTMQGQPFVRYTEAGCLPCSYITIWLLEKPLEPMETYCHIRHNYFGDTGPLGQALAVTIDPQHWAQFDVDRNVYGLGETCHDHKLAVLADQTYAAADFSTLQVQTAWEKNGQLI